MVIALAQFTLSILLTYIDIVGNILVTTRISQDECDPTYVEWLDPCTSGLLVQRFVAGYADGRFRPEHPDELIVAYPHDRSSTLKVVKIDNSFHSLKRFFEKQVEVIGGLVNGSVRCSPDGEFLAFVRCQSDSCATVQIRTCDSLEVWWERLCPISRCDQHDLMKLSSSKSFSHIALTDFANVWVRPVV